MDSLESSAQTNAAAFRSRQETPDVSMTALRQVLVEMRKQARLHNREALVACLTLAISLTKSNPAN